MSGAISPPSAPRSEFYTVRDAAVLTRQSATFWWRVVRERRIRVYRFGRSVRLAAEDLRAFVAAAAEPPAPEGRR